MKLLTSDIKFPGRMFHTSMWDMYNYLNNSHYKKPFYKMKNSNNNYGIFDYFGIQNFIKN